MRSLEEEAAKGEDAWDAWHASVTQRLEEERAAAAALRG